MSIKHKLRRIGQCLAASLLLQMILSLGLWLSISNYPMLPIWGGSLHEGFDAFANLGTFTIFLCLLLLLLNQQNGKVFQLLLLAAVFVCLLDLNKCQIWFYFQMNLLAILSLKNKRPPPQVYAYLRLLFPFLYFWGGIHKINGFYFEDTFPWLMDTFSWTAPLADQTTLIIASIALEIALALGLWLLRDKRVAVLLGFLFHLGILLFLGPFGQNWNFVVWPWNVAMMALLFLLYWPSTPAPPSISWKKGQWKVLLLPLLLIGILPAFNRVGLWPDILSFKLYTGDATEGVLYTDEANLQDLEEMGFPEFNCVWYDTLAAPSCFLIVDDWAFEANGVAPFSTPRRLQQLARHYCACLEKPEQAGLKILEVGLWRKEYPFQHFPCSDLLK